MKKNRFLSMAGSVVLCLNSLFGHSQCTVPGWASQNGGVTGGGMVSPLPLDAAVKEQPVRIYPNPGSGHAVVTVTLEQDEQALIRVYDMQGRMVVNLGTIRAGNGGTQQVPVNLNGQQPGLYYVVVTGDKGLKHTCKLIVK